MTTPPAFIPQKRRTGRVRRRVESVTPTPTPTALTLVAATYDYAGRVQLTFDRAVNIAGMNVAAVTVDDNSAGERYQGAGTPTLVSPVIVEVTMIVIAHDFYADALLNATADNGIVASDDGGTWAGATDLVLPFP